ncbi:MAG TPA: substrate-binding domain-containing protein [Verrucomicrobiota bacterium]|nr:substrate-binding domain-containing protein [Verrucomicrobiota bacterium]
MRRTECLFAIVSLMVLVAAGCKPAAPSTRSEVVVYCAQDHVYAEPILAEFTRQTGIRVRSVYDSEAVKTVGLANRLLAERAHPQCDVFWGNEELRTRQLAAQDVFRPTNGWAAMGYRSRRIVINTNLLDISRAPRSLLELTNAEWRGRVVLAYPLFGSTATHFMALRQHWGAEKWEAWCRALMANRPLMVDGNSVSAKMVARGEAWIGLTDSDDILVEQRRGAPLSALPLTAESLLLPNTVGVVRGAPHPAAAQELFEFLQTRAALAPLVEAGALEGFDVPPEVAASGTLRPDWSRVLQDLEDATARMREIFLR